MADDNGETIIIPIDLWEKIAHYLDVPELGKCTQLSKKINLIVTKDTVWKYPLKRLLHKVFDNAFYIEPKCRFIYEDHMPVPISERPLKSTNFRAWYVEWDSSYEVKIDGLDYNPDRCSDTFWKTAVRGKYMKADGTDISIVDMKPSKDDDGESSHRWLFENVSLKSYYKEAGTFAYMGYYDESQNSDFDPYGEDFYDYDGVLLGIDHKIFQGLPNISLFHGLGGYVRYYDEWGGYVWD